MRPTPRDLQERVTGTLIVTAFRHKRADYIYIISDFNQLCHCIPILQKGADFLCLKIQK